tara:strand:+ start:1664 stop:3751 length:2088 start_codon:yes stop_codon:yes gene_type:complete
MGYGNENNQNPGLTSGDNQSEGNTSPSLSGSNQSFNFAKSIISNQQAKEVLTSTFNEVVISKEKFDSKKIKGIYEDLFYLIPKTGKKSHTSIIEQSTDHVYPEINENYEDTIDSLTNDIVELSKSESVLSTPILTPQHPIYDNGIIVQEGDIQGNFALDPESDLWYIQQGKKRKIEIHSRGYFVRALRQAQGEDIYNSKGSYKPLAESPYFRYLDDDDLNTIDNGTPLETASDFSVDPVLKIDQEFIYSDIDLELTCKGKERFYKFQSGETGYVAQQFYEDPMNIEGGYWYIDPEGYCEIEVWVEIPPTAPYYSQLGGFNSISHKWKGGTKKKINFSRDEKYYGHSIGPKGITDPLDTEFYTGATANLGKHYVTDSPAGFLGNYRNLPKHYIWKWWGEENLFPGIKYVKPGSRITYTMKSPHNASGNVVHPGSHWLNGFINGSTQHAEEQYGMLDSYYDQESNYGTKMVHRDCNGPLDSFGCFGKLNQSNKTQRVMNDPNDRYYKKTVSTTNTHGIYPFKYEIETKGKVYGQPILKKGGDFVVFIGAYSTGAGTYDNNIFYNLDTGGFHKILNKDLDNEIKGYKRNSKALFNWIREDGDIPARNLLNSSNNTIRLNNPTLYFPGLKGAGLNFENTELDSFPATGFLGSIFKSWIGFVQFLNDFDGGDGKDNPFNPKNTGNNYKLEQDISDNIHME